MQRLPRSRIRSVSHVAHRQVWVRVAHQAPEARQWYPCARSVNTECVPEVVHTAVRNPCLLDDMAPDVPCSPMVPAEPSEHQIGWLTRHSERVGSQDGG